MCACSALKVLTFSLRLHSKKIENIDIDENVKVTKASYPKQPELFVFLVSAASARQHCSIHIDR